MTRIKNPLHRTLRSTLGLATVLLLLAGGIIWSDVRYKEPLSLLLGAIGIGILAAGLWKTHRQLSQLVVSLQQLVRGEFEASSAGAATRPGAHSLNAMYHKLHEAADFVETLEEAEGTRELQHLDSHERLGKALLGVKATLLTYRENEEQRHWTTQRMADFADILRNHTDDIEEFGHEVILHLVKYLGMNQGGMFVKTEEDGETWLELKACYAYNRKKYVKKRLSLDEGLVGQCALEQETILMTQVPDQYTSITSGLGAATPSTIVIVPLCWNGEVYGVIEFASFKGLASHELSFLEKAAESIASSLSVVQVNTHLHQMLQSSRELTQEFEQLSLVANNTDNSVVIADKRGRVEFVNQGFTKLTGYTADEVVGRKPGEVLQGPDTDPKTVQRIREKLKQGIPFYEEILNYRKSGESYWISLSINPIRNDAGQVEQYISIQADVTQIKRQTLDYTYKLEAISQSNAIIEFDVKGGIVDANEVFLNVSGYQKAELLRKNFWDLLPAAEADSPQMQMMWDNLQAGTFFSGEFKQRSQEEKELWLRGTFNPIFDLEGELHKIMMFAQFTTYEKEKQTELAGTVQAFSDSVQTLEITPEGKLKKGNTLFLQRFGYKRREVARMKLSDLAETEVLLSDVTTALQDQSSFQLPLTLLTASGERVHCQCSFAGIRNLESELSKIVIIVLETAAEKSAFASA